jgi:nucleosome binding factor SPN SPT16 subunit
MDDLLKSKSEEFAKKFNVEPSFYDFAYSPIIQSGGVYDLKPNAESTNAKLTHDCILLSIGSKYFEFNTNLVRTVLINATKEEQTAYMAIYKGFKTLIKELKPKAVLKDVYDKTRETILSVDKSYHAALPNYFGFGTGLEFRESCLLINDKNDKKVKENQIYNIVLSLKNLKTASGRNFCIQIGDTVRITDEGNIILTDSVSKKYDDIGYTLDGNAEEDKTKNEQKPKKTKVSEILNDNEPGYKTRYRR